MNKDTNKSTYKQAFDVLSKLGLSKDNTDLLIQAKYQKLSADDLSEQEFEDLMTGIKSTPVDKLRDFVDRYKTSLESKKGAAVA